MPLDLDDEVPDRERRMQWLLKNRMREEETVLEPEEFDLKMSWRSGGAQNMLGYARLLSIPKEDFDRAVKGRSCRSYSIPPRCESPMSLENERAALGRVYRGVEQALRRYPTTLEEDEALIPRLTGHHLSLVTLRRDEKVVLTWWKWFFNLAIEALDLSPDEIEDKATQAFGKYHPEGQYLRVTISALVSVERDRVAATTPAP